MPGGDGSGPRGMGPMTGRGAGFCAGYPVAGFNNFQSGYGLGFGRGRGFGGGGRGWRNRFYATGLPGWQRGGWGVPAYQGAWAGAPPIAPAPNPDQELEALRAQSVYLEEALEEIKKRTDELVAGAVKKQG